MRKILWTMYKPSNVRCRSHEIHCYIYIFAPTGQLYYVLMMNSLNSGYSRYTVRTSDGLILVLMNIDDIDNLYYATISPNENAA